MAVLGYDSPDKIHDLELSRFLQKVLTHPMNGTGFKDSLNRELNVDLGYFYPAGYLPRDTDFLMDQPSNGQHLDWLLRTLKFNMTYSVVQRGQYDFVACLDHQIVAPVRPFGRYVECPGRLESGQYFVGQSSHCLQAALTRAVIWAILQVKGNLRLLAC